MKILGIETSCDETAAAVVENGTRVLSSVIFSQIPLHVQTGGVVPEVAAREHVVKIVPMVEEALKKAGCGYGDIDAIAVTQGPGLLSSLVIGVSAAATIAGVLNKPLFPVNHIAGHIYANWLGEKATDRIIFPVVILTVSGGHNELVLMKKHASYRLIGETLDDAAGEAFDKVARLLGLGYPGGPQISRAAENGNPLRFKFPQARMGKDSFDFSFSGLKTAVLNLVQKEHAANGKLSEEFVADCAASFQEAACGVLTDKLLMTAEKYGAKEVHLAGGVSANRRLREMAEEKVTDKYHFDHNGKKVRLTSSFKLRFAQDFSFCTDNAAMVAAAAYFENTAGSNKESRKGPVTASHSGTAKESPRKILTPPLANPELRMYDVAE
jgi:N6-L-threonylcarbamoyladenine synthase